MRRLALVALVVPLLAGCSLLPLGSSGGETISEEPRQEVPRWVHDERLPRRAVPGAKLFAVAGCTTCHTYDGSGSTNLGAPDLTAEGAKNRSLEFQIRHLKCPSCVHPGSPMPRFASLGEKWLRELAIFLVASKGTR
jgi:mono/diheme cytochrome c family protein